MRIIGYIRVSRVKGREGDSFISPDVQRERIEGFAALYGHEVVDQYEDLDESGKSTTRPGLETALARVEAGEADGIIVARLDRFYRSAADGALAIRRLQDANGQLLSVEDNFDSSTPTGRFVMGILLGLAQMELERITESWAEAKGRAVRRGVHISSVAPVGYRRGDDGVLVVEPVTAAGVRLAFELRAKRLPVQAIANRLNDAGHPGHSGRWTAEALRKVFRNRVYLGEARGSGGFVNPAAHEPLVSVELFEAANAARAVPSTRSNGDGALLAGLIRCAGCRYMMSPTTSCSSRSGERVRSYRCLRTDCPSRAFIDGPVVEPFVEAAFVDAVGALEVHVDGNGSGAVDVRAALADAETALENFVTFGDSLDRRLFALGVEQRQAAVDEARAAVEAATASDGLAAEFGVAGPWADLSVAERRRLLTAGLDCVFVRRGRLPVGERVYVVGRGDAPAGLPRRGRRKADDVLVAEPFEFPGD